MKKKIIYFVILIMIIFTASILYLKSNYSLGKEKVQPEIRRDVDPIKTRFPRIGRIEKCLWQAYAIGDNRNIGPSSYRLVGYVILSDEDFSKFTTQFEWTKVDKIQPILPQEELGITTNTWLYSRGFNDYVKSASFVGDFYLDRENKLLYFDVQK